MDAKRDILIMLIAIRHRTDHHDPHIVRDTIYAQIVIADCTNDPRHMGAMKRSGGGDVPITIETVVDVIFIVTNYILPVRRRRFFFCLGLAFLAVYKFTKSL